MTPLPRYYDRRFLFVNSLELVGWLPLPSPTPIWLITWNVYAYRYSRYTVTRTLVRRLKSVQRLRLTAVECLRRRSTEMWCISSRVARRRRGNGTRYCEGRDRENWATWTCHSRLSGFWTRSRTLKRSSCRLAVIIQQYWAIQYST